MEQFIIGATLFIVLVIVVELLIYGYKNMRSPNRAKIRKRLRKSVYAEDNQAGTDILRKRVLSEIPFLNRLLLKTPGILKLDNLISQANATYPIGFFILLALFLAVLGFLVGNTVIKNRLLAVMLMFLCGSFPFLYLLILKQKRTEKFKKQLPEALDLMSRALKAGHAFTNGLKLAADEFNDPLGPEFAEVLDEINFGVSVSNALRNLAKRVECPEIKYFVVGVILQRETGGNLAELMGILAFLIREKFKFQGKVRTLSAEGRLSAFILIALPFGIAGWMWFSNPKYLDPLLTDPIGKIMIIGAAIMMVFGIIVMKKIVAIEV
ncbi:MAG: type II secretion system F family protein [Desulfobacterales bacterium]|jgi:tight adherence protein B|nr:type II secretion system F family protein [Desulfobacterales bacterium]